jgi:hypothetical protein
LKLKFKVRVCKLELKVMMLSLWGIEIKVLGFEIKD